MKTFLYMAALTGLFILPSCLKNNTATPADVIKFPTTQGDYWVYKVTDYQKNTVDTVTVSVVGSIKDPLQAGYLTILQRKWPNEIDSQYVSIVNDTLAFYFRSFIEPEDQLDYKLYNFIVYPLPVGKSYSSVLLPAPNISYSSDSVRMISSQSVDIHLNNSLQGFTAFSEEKTFLLTTWGPMPEYLIFTDDFIPGIGIINETLTFRAGYPNVTGTMSKVLDTWQLLYSNLNDPPPSGSVNP
ncbi:MAG: hypothetical protein EPN39_04245 [Chitinophagaceae bacterium]|nr:MAG: hypothetical protein EPN39_04245 [Chitinophagaceae bacterium]